MSPPRLLIIALPLLLAGCTFRAAMTRGQEAVDRADWPAAARASAVALVQTAMSPRRWASSRTNGMLPAEVLP